MVRFVKLDKVIKEGTTYEMGNNEFLIIKKIGTDSTSGAQLVIDGIPLGTITSTVAPLKKDSTNGLGLLDLEELYYVVPPAKKYWVEGGGSDKVRIVGLIGKLSMGESMPSEYEARFARQHKEYKTYVTGSLSLGTDVAFTAGAEQEVYSVTPATTEKYIFDDIVMMSVSGGTVDWGYFSTRFYKQGEPIDVLVSSEGTLGIDVLALPSPPTTIDYEEPFTLRDAPIVVEGDESFSVKVINVSGSDLAPTTGSSWTFNFTAIVRYNKK